MSDFEILIADKVLNDVLSSINGMDVKAYTACHGSYHANFVASRTGKILADLNFDKRTVEIGKITGLLHDVGCKFGKNNHAIKSSQICEVFLCKTNIMPTEKDVIIRAIADHSNGDNIRSAIGAALLIADKTDLSKERVLDRANVNDYHKNLLEVESVDVSIKENEIVINFLASEKFSTTVLNELWSKAFTVPMKAAKYLGCSAVFMVNNLRVGNIYFDI